MSDSPVEKALEDMSKKELGQVKAMMIEDDQFLSQLVLTKLAEKGCIPYSVKSGNEALELAKQYQPHVIILDLMLPGVSGEDILKQLKADSELSSIPVIVFSNKSDETTISQCLADGAHKYLVKSSTDLNGLAKIVLESVDKANS